MGNKGGKEAACVPEMQRLSYDLSPLQELNVPVIWIIGAPGTGRDIQCSTIEETYGFDVIKIMELLRTHSSNETDRGRVIKENLDKRKGHIPDTIVLDIIKEEMLSKVTYTTGFVLNGFPLNKHQAEMFVSEIGNVDLIIYLHCNIKTMVARVAVETDRADTEGIRREIERYSNPLAGATDKFNPLIEKFDTGKNTMENIFPKIQSALNVRIMGGKMVKASD